MDFKLLLIDDEVNIVKALKRIFDKEDYTLFAATTPAAALEILKTTKIDMILCDYQMPGMLGIDILKYARLVQPEAVRILVTGSADIKVAITAINEGSIYYFFTKPWDNDEMLTVVRKALDEKRDREEMTSLYSMMNASKDSLLEVTNKLNALGSLIEAHNTGRETPPPPKKLTVLDGDTIIPVSISDILYIAAVDDNVLIVVQGGSFKSQESLSALEKKLAQDKFFRCHRSYIVNIDEIDKITPWFNGAYNIRLRGSNENIPVSRNNARKLKELFEN